MLAVDLCILAVVTGLAANDLIVQRRDRKRLWLAECHVADLKERVSKFETHPWFRQWIKDEPVKLRTVHVTKDDPGSAA